HASRRLLLPFSRLAAPSICVPAAAPPLPILCTTTVGRGPIHPTLAAALLSLSPSAGGGSQHGAATPSGAMGSRRGGDGVVARQRIHARPCRPCSPAGPVNNGNPDLGRRGEEGSDRNGSPADPVLQTDLAALRKVHGHSCGRRRRGTEFGHRIWGDAGFFCVNG
ncbi:unnamed protein product, partial [Urochloa humidicola]